MTLLFCSHGFISNPSANRGTSVPRSNHRNLCDLHSRVLPYTFSSSLRFCVRTQLMVVLHSREPWHWLFLESMHTQDFARILYNLDGVGYGVVPKHWNYIWILISATATTSAHSFVVPRSQAPREVWDSWRGIPHILKNIVNEFSISQWFAKKATQICSTSDELVLFRPLHRRDMFRQIQICRLSISALT